MKPRVMTALGRHFTAKTPGSARLSADPGGESAWVCEHRSDSLASVVMEREREREVGAAGGGKTRHWRGHEAPKEDVPNH